MAFVRCRLNVTAPGKVKLLFNSVDGLSLWVGTVPVDVKPKTVLDLKQGTHRLTFNIDLSKRKDPLRIELVDEPGSSAKADFINGK